MPGSNKAMGTGVLQGVTAHLPLIIIPLGSPPLPSDSISEQLQNTRKPAPPATPITRFQKQLPVQLVAVGWFHIHACQFLSALRSLTRRLEIAINSQQALLTPLTESSACTWSALMIPPVFPQLRWTRWVEWIHWKASSSFSFRRPKERSSLRDTSLHVCTSLNNTICFQRLWSQRSSQLQPPHWRNWIFFCHSKGGIFIISLWSEIDFQFPVLSFVHCASHEGI